MNSGTTFFSCASTSARACVLEAAYSATERTCCCIGAALGATSSALDRRASSGSKIAAPSSVWLSNIGSASGAAIAGLPIVVSLNCCYSFSAPSGSTFNSTRPSSMALRECSSMRPAPAGVFSFEPGLTSRNLP